MTPGNLICDLDGVVYLGTDPVPGSAEALSKLEVAGWNVLLCTNNSSRSPGEVASRLREITGYDASPEAILTSAQAAALLLSDSKPPTFVLGGSGVVEALHDAGVTVVDNAADARAVVVGLAVDLSYKWLRDTVTAVRNGARFIATNLDVTYPTDEGIWPGAGAIVAAVEAASGVKPETAGKPWPPMRDLITRHLGPGPVWVVGDRPDTDLALAEGTGWNSALVLTGVTMEARSVLPAPDLIAPDLASVVRFLLEQGEGEERL